MTTPFPLLHQSLGRAVSALSHLPLQPTAGGFYPQDSAPSALATQGHHRVFYIQPHWLLCPGQPLEPNSIPSVVHIRVPVPTDGHCSRDRGPSSSGAYILSLAQEGLVSQLGGASFLPPPSQDLLSVGVLPRACPSLLFFIHSPSRRSFSTTSWIPVTHLLAFFPWLPSEETDPRVQVFVCCVTKPQVLRVPQHLPALPPAPTSVTARSQF